MSINSIVPLIKYQFPSLYRESGPQLIAFVEAYYEWMEQFDSRTLIADRDIDTSPDAFADYFNSTYLNGIPLVDKTNNNLIIKHVHDLYRTKGTPRGIKLLLKIIYGVDADVYFPHDDIMKTSSGDWYDPKYIELSDSPHNKDLVGKQIKGLTSNTTAYVEYLVVRNNTSVAYVTNIVGKFVNNEIIISDQQYDNSPIITGSVTDVYQINNGGSNLQVHDKLTFCSSSGKYGKATVKATNTKTNVVDISVVSSGSHYTLNPVFSYGNSVSSSNAVISVNQLSDPYNTWMKLDDNDQHDYNDVVYLNAYYRNVVVGGISVLSVEKYGENYTSIPQITAIQRNITQTNDLITVSDGSQYTVNERVTLSGTTDTHYTMSTDVLQFSVNQSVSFNNGIGIVSEVSANTITITNIVGTVAAGTTGTINGIAYSNLHPTVVSDVFAGTIGNITGNVLTIYYGSPYVFTVGNSVTGANGSQTVSQVSKSNQQGSDAVFNTVLKTVTGSITQLAITDSGVQFADGENVLMYYNNVPVASATIAKTAVGRSQGYYRNSKGHLSSTSKLQDGVYYQQFSYDIRSALPFSAYAEVLNNVMHVAGTVAYGSVVVSSVVDTRIVVGDSIVYLNELGFAGTGYVDFSDPANSGYQSVLLFGIPGIPPSNPVIPPILSYPTIDFRDPANSGYAGLLAFGLVNSPQGAPSASLDFRYPANSGYYVVLT